jgi:hypothetical protein
MSDVFIIGAGCSVPYGFPTGTMLMQNILRSRRCGVSPLERVASNVVRARGKPAPPK